MNVELMLRIIQSCVCCIQAPATEQQQGACLCVRLCKQMLVSAEMKRRAALFKADVEQGKGVFTDVDAVTLPNVCANTHKHGID